MVIDLVALGAAMQEFNQTQSDSAVPMMRATVLQKLYK